MKKLAIASILGIAVSSVAVNSAKGDGYFIFENYNSSGPAITYGAGSGGTVGAGIDSTFTAGLYYALGNVTGSVASDPTGVADPSILGGGLTLLTGNSHDTAPISPTAFPGPGIFSDYSGYTVIPGDTGGLVTLEVVAYNGSSYDTSTVRGHSLAFTITPSIAPQIPIDLGYYMPVTGHSSLLSPSYSNGTVSFSVYPVPEPSMIAIGGLGMTVFIILRRRSVSQSGWHSAD